MYRLSQRRQGLFLRLQRMQRLQVILIVTSLTDSIYVPERSMKVDRSGFYLDF